MLSDEILDKLVERLVKRIEDVNIYTLKDIARIIKELRTLRPSDTHKLVQIMQYGGDYRKIVQKLSEINNINEKEIYEIFDEVAKSDVEFAEQFYKYRNKDYIPWSSNIALREQVKAMAEITANEYRNLSRTLAFSRTVNGKVEYTELSRLYQDIIDRGITSITQGKSSFDQEFRRTIKDLAKSGIKSVNWESGVARRLDSAVRMNLKTGLRELHNEAQRIIGKQIDADGVEITVHSNPAPDHQEAQGRQFTNEQYDRLQRTGFAVDVNGKEINMHRELKRTEAFSLGFRPISQYNCYHYSFSVVLGVSKPLFSDEQLQDIMDRNDKGFDYEGKHYSMYEGTQLQRKIETAIRKEKDTQIMAKASGDNDLAQESQGKINQLMNKYVELSNISGLPTKMERIRVDGYKPVKVIPKMPEIPKDIPKTIPKVMNSTEVFVSKEENKRLSEIWIKHYEKEKKEYGHLRPFEEERYNRLLEQKKNGYKDETIKLDNIENCNKLLDKVNTEIRGEEIKNTDFRLVQESTVCLYNYSKSSPAILDDLKRNRATLQAEKNISSVANTLGNRITLNNGDYSDYNKFYDMCKDNTELHLYASGEHHSWWSEVAKENITKETITHEFGHRLHFEITHKIKANVQRDSKVWKYYYDKYGIINKYGNEYIDKKYWEIERDLIYEPIKRLQKKTGMTQKEIINKYVSMYGRKTYSEMFAETFANSVLGKSNALGDEFMNFLIELGEWEV